MTELQFPPEIDESFRAIRERIENAKREGSVYIGGTGDRRISLPAYYKAARSLFQSAKDAGQLRILARPILYLQRHTVELALKRLIWDLRCIEKLSSDIEANKLGPRAEYPKGGHDLEKLCKALRETFGKYHEWLTVPQALLDLAADVIDFEGRDPTRLRYDTGLPHLEYAESSFPVPQTGPVTRWQTALDELMTGPLAMRDEFTQDFPKAQWTIVEKLEFMLWHFQNRHEKAGLSRPEKLSAEELMVALDGMNDAFLVAEPDE